MMPIDRLDAATARIPDYLRDSTAMAVARLEPDGAVADANRGFVRAAGGPESEFEPSGGAWNAAVLGGEVSLTSRPGVGSTFRFRLPPEYAGPAEVDIRGLPAGARP